MSLFKKPSELKVNAIVKVLIYGQPGTGKTTIALSSPSPVLFDFDGGVMRVNGAFQCPTLQVESWDEVLQAMDEDLSKFHSIIIDTAGKMLDFMSAYIIKNDNKMQQRDGSLSLKGYGVRKRMFCDFIARCSMLGKNVIFVAHEKEDKDGEQRIVRPEMSGSSLGDLIKELDLVGYMQMIGNERTINWSPTEKFYAKNTCNLPPVQNIPQIIDASGNVTSQNKFLTGIFAAWHKYLKAQADTTQQYDALIDIISENVEAITDVTTANEVTMKIEGMHHIWDSKIKGAAMIAKRCKSLGLSYDKINKCYVQQSA